MNKSPLVSVVMAFYNAEDFILEAVQSILKQTYENIELILVDDGSEDGSLQIVRKIAIIHDNVRIVENDVNKGLAASINVAIPMSSGKFIARMDADDIMMKSRISSQVTYLLKHPEVDVIGGSLQYIGNSSYYNSFPETHDSCIAQLCFSVCFGHPSVMFRASVFEDSSNFYNEALLQYSEDYELWCRLSFDYKFANLKNKLVKYRTFPGEIKSTAEDLRRKNSRKIREEYLLHVFKGYDSDYFELHHQISRYTIASVNGIKDAHAYLEYLMSLESTIDKFALRKIVARVYFDLCYTKINLGKMVHWLFIKSRYWKYYRPSIYVYMKFIYKTITMSRLIKRLIPYSSNSFEGN